MIIDFQPVGRRIEVEPGTNLLEAARQAGIQLTSVCGGIGACDTCRVRLAEGRLSQPSLEEEAALSPEELADGYRLACQSIPRGDVKIHIPPESLTAPQRLQLEGQETGVEVDPLVRPMDLQLAPPTNEDLRGDDERLAQALEEAGAAPGRYSTALLRELPAVLRGNGWRLRIALRGDELVAALPLGCPLYGFAVDAGSTKLAAYLVDLSTGRTAAQTGAMNPQVVYGEDVVSRIAYANQGPEKAALLHTELIGSLNQMLAQLRAEVGIRREQVVEAVLVGNTAIHHFLLGLPVRQLGEAPYVPAVARAIEARALDLGLEIAPGARVFLPPNVAGYVGADHVAMVLATGLAETARTALALDIGTNTEITLAAGGRLLSCSTASGPVFEGAHIRDGMRAASGAIERVQWIDNALRYQTIGEQAPVGICGSGILDAVAALLNAGALDAAGRLQREHPLVQQVDGLQGVTLAPAPSTGHGRDIRITRRDVHEIQLAKGAIRAGTEILLQEAGITAQDLDEVVIAGAFGTYIDIPAAVQVGMFPALPMERFRQVGNAAGVGARQMLVSACRRRLALDIARRIEYIELTTHLDFTARFVEEMHFKTGRKT